MNEKDEHTIGPEEPEKEEAKTSKDDLSKKNKVNLLIFIRIYTKYSDKNYN